MFRDTIDAIAKNFPANPVFDAFGIGQEQPRARKDAASTPSGQLSRDFADRKVYSASGGANPRARLQQTRLRR